MIIDLILDRKDGKAYNAKEFYDRVTEYENNMGVFDTIGYDSIAMAMDSGTEEDVKRALTNYIYKNDYNRGLVTFINFNNWIQ